MNDVYDWRELTEVADRAHLRAAVGDKAADMVALCRDAHTAGARFPPFTVVGVPMIDDILLGSPAAVNPADLPEVPRATDIPATARRLDAEVARFLEPRFGHRFGRATVLRTSMLWPIDDGHRPPGVDSTVMVQSWPPPLSAPILSGLWKAYTTFCLSNRGLDANAPRRAGLVVMDLIPNVRWQGTAYAVGDQLALEVAPLRGRAGRFWKSAADLRRTGPLAPSESDRLVGLLTDLVPRSAGGLRAGTVEFEFLIDTAGRPIVLQRRLLPTGVGLFHSAGSYDGPIVDLRTARRTNVADAISRCSGRAVMLPVLDEERLDSFSFAWWSRRTTDEPPTAMVLLVPSESRSGMRAHLPWTLREAIPGNMVVTLAETGVPAGVSGVGLTSDGVRVTAAWR